jgi:hypothetical protein
MLRNLMTQKCSQTFLLSDFRYPRACRFRKYQIENRLWQLPLSTFGSTSPSAWCDVQIDIGIRPACRWVLIFSFSTRLIIAGLYFLSKYISFLILVNSFCVEYVELNASSKKVCLIAFIINHCQKFLCMPFLHLFCILMNWPPTLLKVGVFLVWHKPPQIWNGSWPSSSGLRCHRQEDIPYHLVKRMVCQF